MRTASAQLAHGDPLAALVTFADAIGADAIARDIRDLELSLDDGPVRADQAARFCERLEQHLLEQRRALTRSPAETRDHAAALTACKRVVERVIHSMQDQPPLTNAGMRAELEHECRKLTMSDKADLLAILGTCVAKSQAPKRKIEAHAAALADDIGIKTIHAWRAALQARVDRRLAGHMAELLERARIACSEHADTILTPAFLGVSALASIEPFAPEPPPRPRADRRAALRTLFARTSDVRTRAERDAADRLVMLLERESQRIVDGCVRCYADACAQLHTTFANALDAYVLAATAAGARASAVTRTGGPAVEQALAHVDRQLDQLALLLPAV